MKLQLQYIRQVKSSDDAENIHKRKRPKVIQELGLNLESAENAFIKMILQDAQMGKIDRNVAFAKIKAKCSDIDIYNDAEIS